MKESSETDTDSPPNGNGNGSGTDSPEHPAPADATVSEKYICHVLSCSEDPLTAHEIAERTQIPVSTVYDALSSLHEADEVTFSLAGGRRYYRR